MVFVKMLSFIKRVYSDDMMQYNNIYEKISNFAY